MTDRTRDITFYGQGREGSDLVVRLRDDGYRIWASYVSGGPDSDDPDEEILWAEYKHCDSPSLGYKIADVLMVSQHPPSSPG